MTAIGKSQEMTGERVRIEKVRSDEGGYILIMSLFVLVTLFLIGVALAVVGINEFHLSARTKMMDQAYSIAEAGVSQATVELKIKPDLVRETGDGVNNYPNGTPQWETSGWVDFGGGQFKVQLYQSEMSLYNTNPRYKVIKSTGRVNNLQRTAERTIEVRFVAGAANQQYDASFDYLISVFNKDRVDQGLVPYPFPPGGGVATEFYTLDGKSQDDATNGSGSMMYPKGCYYARGPIHSYKIFFGNFQILGNIVSTDAIVQYSSFAGLLIPNMQLLVDGNMIAGFDPTVPGGTPFPAGLPYGVPEQPTVKMGDISINIGFTGLFSSGLKVGSGSYVAAANDVTFTSIASLGFASPVEITGGIIAGGNVSCASAFSITKPLSLGNIFCGGETGGGNVLIQSGATLGCTFGNINAKTLDIKSVVALATGSNIYVSDKFTATTVAAPVNVGEIHAGRGTDNVSVDIDIVSLFTNFTAPKITCTGEAKVDILVAIGTFNVQNVTAGLNPVNGRGITFNSISGIGSVPKLEAGGDIVVTNAGGAVYIDDVTSANNVNLTLGALLRCNAGTVTAGGDLTVNITAGLGNSLGDMKAGGNISCTAAAILGSNIANLSAVGNIDLTVTPGLASSVANVYARGNIDIDTGGGVAVGIGKVWAGGNVGSLDDRMTLSALTGVGSVNDLSGGIRAGGSVYIGNTALSNITGPIQANGNVDITNTFGSWLSTFSCDGIWAGQSIKLLKSAGLENYWEVGLINDGSEDGIRYGTTADLTCGTVALSKMAIGNFDGVYGYITYQGSAPTKSGSGTIYSKGERPRSVASPGIGSPTVDLGTLPTIPSDPDFPGDLGPFPYNPNGSNDSYDKLKHTPPKVDSKVLLELAGLEAPVTPLDPNWAYFEEQAKMDDLELAKTKPAWVTLAPHVLTDNGPYDQDPTLGKITWNWTTGSKYINRLETIYVGESYAGNPSGFVDLKITGLDMAGADIQADVIATIVCRGDIYMDITESSQNTKTGQTLNLVAGHDITRNVSTDVAFGNAEKTFLHFYAGHDVKLQHWKLTWFGSRAFLGSITAGNEFFWYQEAFGANTTARWTRWALDPEAFAPKIKVISWEEI